MAISNKYKHGDIVVWVDYEKRLDFGKVLEPHKITNPKQQKAYKKCLEHMSGYAQTNITFVVCIWLDPNDLTYIEEEEVRLATPAEITLFYKASEKHGRKNI